MKPSRRRSTKRYTPAQRRVFALLDHWDSMAELARDLGVSYWTVASWLRRGCIPPEWTDDILASARRRRLHGVIAAMGAINPPQIQPIKHRETAAP